MSESVTADEYFSTDFGSLGLYIEHQTRKLHYLSLIIPRHYFSNAYYQV
jgi:hypothetical protein